MKQLKWVCLFAGLLLISLNILAQQNENQPQPAPATSQPAQQQQAKKVKPAKQSKSTQTQKKTKQSGGAKQPAQSTAPAAAPAQQAAPAQPQATSENVPPEWLAVDFSGNIPLTPDNLKKGSIYVVGFYNEDMDELLREGNITITNPDDFTPLNSIEVLGMNNLTRANILSGIEIYRSHLALGHYNSQGQWVVESFEKYQIIEVDFSDATKKVMLKTKAGEIFNANWMARGSS